MAFEKSLIKLQKFPSKVFLAGADAQSGDVQYKRIKGKEIRTIAFSNTVPSAEVEREAIALDIVLVQRNGRDYGRIVTVDGPLIGIHGANGHLCDYLLERKTRPPPPNNNASPLATSSAAEAPASE